MRSKLASDSIREQGSLSDFLEPEDETLANVSTTRQLKESTRMEPGFEQRSDHTKEGRCNGIYRRRDLSIQEPGKLKRLTLINIGDWTQEREEHQTAA